MVEQDLVGEKGAVEPILAGSAPSREERGAAPSSAVPIAMSPYRPGIGRFARRSAVWRTALPLGERGGVGSPRERRGRVDKGGNPLGLSVMLQKLQV